MCHSYTEFAFFQTPCETKEVIRTLRIRLRRMGKKKSPFYRIVVADSRDALDGRFKEILGHYDPYRRVPPKLELDRVEWWMSKGAKPTGSVMRLISIVKQGAEEENPELEAATIDTTEVDEEAETEEQTEEDS